MPTRTVRTEIHNIAVAPRKLAFLVDPDHEERLIELSDRLVAVAYELQQLRLPDYPR